VLHVPGEIARVVKLEVAEGNEEDDAVGVVGAVACFFLRRGADVFVLGGARGRGDELLLGARAIECRVSGSIVA